MGQAKKRGTFEERKQQAIERDKKKYTAQLLCISNIRKDLIENKDNIKPILKRHNPKMVLAIVAALS